MSMLKATSFGFEHDFDLFMQKYFNITNILGHSP